MKFLIILLACFTVQPAIAETAAERNQSILLASLGQPYPDRVGVQTYLLKARQFFYTSRAVLSATLNERISDYYGSAHLADQVANVRVSYAPNGAVEEIAIESDDAWIRSTLASSINWNFLPRPSEFSLPYKAVDITVLFDQEGVSIRMDPR